METKSNIPQVPKVTVKDLLESRNGIPVPIAVSQYLGNKAVFTNGQLYLSSAMHVLYKAAVEENDQAALENLASSIEVLIIPGLSDAIGRGFFMMPMREPIMSPIVRRYPRN